MLGSISGSSGLSWADFGLAQRALQSQEERGSGAAPAGTDALTPEQQRQLEQLKNRDREVRQHEQAHLAAGRDLVQGGASYTYETGPDRQKYAVGGEVSIDVSPGKTPEETIAKAQRIRAAALAPAEPSTQDRRVASVADRMEQAARIELESKRRTEATAKNTTSPENALPMKAYRASADSSLSPRALGGFLNTFA